MFTLTLADGQQIKNLFKNGTNYISKKKIDESIFENNLKTLTITDDSGNENELVMHDAYLIQQVTYDKGENWWMCFAEKTKEELQAEQIDSLSAQLYYVQMMTDTFGEEE